MNGPNDFLQIKITDFGLAEGEKNSKNAEFMTGQAGTFHWMAPEVL